MGEPLFSIVTITYQNLLGLEETLESVQAQRCRDFEHVVVDGGSTDGTADWLQQNFDGVWLSEPDRGRYDAMNKGARMAKGTYLWFLHAGDAFGDALVLDRVAGAMHNGQSWGYGLARVVNPERVLEGTLGFVPFSLFNFAILARPLPHQATFLRRDFFWRLGGYDQRAPGAADQRLLLRAASIAAPVALADFLCDFDSTGISAGRHWWVDFWDAEKNRRQMDHPLTRWRSLDSGLSLAYALFRQIARMARQVMSYSK